MQRAKCYEGELLLNSPGRHIFPTLELLGRPCKSFFFVAGCARIRNFICSRHRRGNESKGVAADVLIGERLFDLWHVTRDALPARAAGFVVRVFFDRARMRTVRRARTVAFEAHHVCRFDQ